MIDTKFFSGIVMISTVSCSKSKLQKYSIENNINKNYDLSKHTVYNDSFHRYNSRVYYHYYIALTIGNLQ